MDEEHQIKPPYLRIAVEEAYAPPELFRRYRRLLEDGSHGDPGFQSLVGFYLNDPSPGIAKLRERMVDLGPIRLRDMDETGIAKQVLSLTSPGVQVFDAPTAVSLAREFNDQLRDAILQYPDRFAGLAAIAPQDPAEAAKELERSVTRLGLKGAIVNSHTHGEYLDDPKFWSIFEAAEALQVPVYVHPGTAPASMIGPFLERGLDGAIYGFAVETGLHALGLIVRGVFDRFPKLRVVLGHLGEALPYWMTRIDFMHARMTATSRYPGIAKLKRKPSEYLKENFWVTTSGMAWEPAILYAQSVLGVERVLYAMDYPYQFVASEVTAIDNLPIGDAEKKMLYQSNAERLFKL